MSARIIISSAQLNILNTNKSSHRHNMSSAFDIMLSTPDLSMQKKVCVLKIPLYFLLVNLNNLPGHVAQSVTCLATDACLTADPGVASSIWVRSHTFVEIDHEMISTVILLPSADSFKKGCCQ